MTTLKDRMTLAMKGPPKVSQTALARACSVDPSTVNDWVSGRIKAIKGDNLIPAARFLNVSAEWLATGRGEMRGREGDVKNSRIGMGDSSQIARMDATTLGKAMKFAKAYLAARGESVDIESRPHLVLTAYAVITEIESTMDEADLVEAMGRMARRIGVEGGDDRRATG